MITMITDRIGIGDAQDGRQLDPAVDATLNVAVDLDIPLTGGSAHRHKVGLLDGTGNDDLLLISAVLVLHALNRKYRRILVHCQTGSSGSVMVVAAYVSIIGNMDFKSVLTDIMKVRNVSEYRQILFQQYTSLLPKIRNILGLR